MDLEFFDDTTAIPSPANPAEITLAAVNGSE
jgi:hypothetical protein